MTSTRPHRAALALLLSLLLLALGLPTSAIAAPLDGEITLESYISGHQGEVPTVSAGDVFSITVNLQCSSPDAGVCRRAVLNLDLPEPVEYVSDAMSISPSVATGVVNGRRLTVTFDDEGLTAGQLVVLTANVTIPDHASGNLDGDTVSAGVEVTADNAETVNDSVAMKLDIPPVLVADATKTVSPTGTQPALPGRTVTYTLTGANSSNVSVDSVQIAEPVNPSSATPFTYLAVTDISTLTAPEGADRVDFEWFDGSDWHRSGAVAIPTNPHDLLPTDPGLILGMRFTFTKNGSVVPAGKAGTIVVVTQTRADAFSDLASGATRTISNRGSVTVNYGGTSVDDQATAAVPFKNTPVEVSTAKSITGNSLVAGANTVVTIDATNGIMPVTTMQIDEPAAGQLDLTAQGLAFNGFVTSGTTDQRVEWPHDAARAQVTYRYSDGSQDVLTTSTVDTLPDPASEKDVSSFSVVFTGDNDAITSGATAKLAFSVTAGPVTVEAGTNATNTVRTTVTNASANAGTSTASDDVLLLPQRVRTSASKTISRDSLWATAGSSATVSLTGAVTQESTIGSDHLTLTDNSYTFWDSFNLRRIVATDVPANAQLSVEYYDGSTWQTLTTQAGPAQDWSYTPSNPDLIAGIRFTFTPLTAGDTLPVGFNVAPRFEVSLRQNLRSNPLILTSSQAPTTLINQLTAEASNPVAIEPVVTSSVTDSVELKSTDGSGGSAPDLVAKNWVTEHGIANADHIYAISNDTRTARLDWDTDGLSMSSMEVTDDPRGAGGGSIAASSYDAFDLVAIEPITASVDPLIGKDKVAKVELATGAGWTDITAQACPSASACDGRFPGYTLTSDQQASTVGVRLTFAPGSSSATGAIAISDTVAPHRGILLTMKLRNALRSDPAAFVLGTSHGYTYNTGTAGVVNNRADALGTLTAPTDSGVTSFADTASADMVIYDRPLNISLTKSFDQDRLGLPQAATTSQDDYPLITSTLTVHNDTATYVPEITLSDPSPTVSDLGAYEYLNLYQIESVAIPDDLSQSDVTVDLVHFDGASTTTEAGISLATATSRTPAQLADVVGVSVHYGAEANLGDPNKALIASGASATLNLVYQLRPTQRTGGEPTAPIDQVTNSARAAIVSPGGMGCSGGSDCDQPTADSSDSFGITQPTYAVSAGKAISPSSRYEDQPNTYTVTLAGQPSGTARTKLLTLTDQTPTFWNAFDFTAIGAVSVPDPINQLKLSVLTGVVFSYDGTTLNYTCNGSPVLDGCWHEGSWEDAVNGVVNLNLPAGISADQVRGVRVEARRVVNGATVQWERPSSPTLRINMSTTRRTYLVYGTGGDITTPVPSTRPGLATAPGETTRGTTTNQVTAVGTAGWLNNTAPYTDTATTTATTQLLHRANQIKVEKTPGRANADAELPRFDLNQAIPFHLKITNTGAWNMTGLALTDQIGTVNVGGYDQSGLIPADVSSVFTFTVNGTAVTGFNAALNTATGALSITVPNGFVLTPGSVLLITANLRFIDHLEAGTTISNSVSVTSDRAFEKCDYATDGVSAAALTDVTTCSSSTRVVAAASTPITVTKSVKGIAAGDPSASVGDDNYNDLGVISVGNADSSLCAAPGTDGYYAPPCTPITRPGGTERWRLTLANGGNVSANTISAIDVLPAVGDTGVTVGTARKSRFTPVFAGNVQVTLPDGSAAHAVHTYLLTSTATVACNKSDILNDTTPGGTTNCNLPWAEFTDATPAATLAKAKAIKVVVTFDDAAKGIAPGGAFQMTFDTTTPPQAELADPTTVEPVAWNSAAIGSRTAYVAPTEDTPELVARASLITEPRKAGVAIASGRIDLAKTVSVPTGATWTAALPTSYTGTLSCTSLGDGVILNGTASASDTSKVALSGTQGAGTGTTVNYNADGSSTLPLFAVCAFHEDAAQGATAAVSPKTVTAHNSYAGIANVAHGWNGAATELLGVTNTYDNAGFTVTKHVTGPAATDASGAAVSFNDFAYTASCKLNDIEVMPAAQRAFSLRDGQSQQFDGLPAGADCTVKETYAASAADTTISASQGTTTIIDADNDETATFTLVAGDATATAVDYTNRYTVGAVTITKAIVDPTGLWGGENFEAHLVCTHPDTVNPTVYDGYATLSKSSPTQTISSLPTGASCVVTETKTGGANATSISGGAFTVGSDPGTPSAVTITNTFTTGSVKVTKKVQANGIDTTASPWSDGNFPVTLACTRVVDGVTTPLSISGATQTLNKDAWSYTWDNLPTGAICSATEDTAGITGVGTAQPLAGTTITAPVTVTAGASGNITVTNDYTAGKLVINKALTGAGASFFTGSTFSASCTLDGSAVFSQTGITVTSPTMKSAEIGPIPFGAVCTATETATGGADATPTATPVTITADGATNNVSEVTFTNAFSAGRVTISKVLTGAAAGETWATSPTFTLAVKCGLAAAGPYSYNGTVSLKGGQSAVLQKSGSDQLFPVGTHCWATETVTANATSTTLAANSFANGVVVTAQVDPSVPQELGITATNVYEYASLTVTKTVVKADAKDQDGNALAYNRTYTATASCATFNGVAILSTQTMTFTDQGGGVWGPSTTFNNLPAKASCTVTETVTGGANSTTYTVTQNGTTSGSTSGTTKTLTLASGSNTVAFTNTYTIGSITIAKVLAGTGTSWATFPITVNLTCTASWFSPTTVYTKDFTFTSATDLGPRTITNLPTGAACNVTEPNHHGADAFAATNVTVSTGATIRAAKATNTYNTGAVTVTKQLKVDGAITTTAQPWVSGGYPVTLSCTKDLDGDGSAEAVHLGANATKTITGNSSATWTGLPAGAVCSITEDTANITYPAETPTQPQPSVTVSGTATVPTDSTYTNPATITVTNDFGYGSVTITKTLAGAAVDTWGVGTFTFHTSCAMDGFGTPVFEADTSLSKATTLTASGIGPVPVGAVCTVTETDNAWATSVTPASAKVTLAPMASGGVGEADFTNTFDYAGFTVTKAVSTSAKDASGAGIAYTGAYPFSASCKIGDTEFLAAEQRSFTLTDGQSKSFEQLPSGAVCTVAEIDAFSAARTSITTDQIGHAQTVEDGTSAQFTLVNGGTSATTLRFTNTYSIGAATITKAVTGSGADVWGNHTFTVHAVCTLDLDGNPATDPNVVFDASKDLTKSANEWTLIDLPTGAACTVSETASGGANTAADDVTFVVNADPIHPSTITMTNIFTTGSVRIDKVVTVDGKTSSAQPYASAEFQVKLACTRLVNGTQVAIDIPGDGFVAGDTADGVRTITGAGSALYEGLPTGAQCVASEVAAEFALPGSQVAVDQPGAVDADVVQTATITNDYRTSSLKITKALTGDGASDWADADAIFTVDCELTGTKSTVPVFHADDVALSRATSLISDELGPIPVGAECTVTETGTGGATIGASPATVTIAAGTSTGVTMTNQFDVGTINATTELTVSGVTTSANPYAGSKINLKLTCEREVNGSWVTVPIPGGASVQITGAGSHLFTGLPVGARCSLNQSDASLTPQDVSYRSSGGTTTVTPPTEVVSGTSTITLTAIDNFDTQPLVIEKVLSGTGASDFAVHPFTFSVSCTLTEAGAAEPHVVYANDSVTLSTADGLVSAGLGPVPIGSECTVTETASGGATVASTPQVVTISATAENRATLTNAFDTGKVLVTKKVLVDGSASDAEPYASGTYTMKLSCTQDVDGQTLPVAIPGGDTRTVTGSATAEFASLPLGATCAVSESASSLAIPADQVTIDTPTITVGEGTTGVQVSNDFHTSDLLVKVGFTGVGRDTFAEPVSLEVNCTLAGAPNSVLHQVIEVAPTPGQDFTTAGPLGPIPVGAVCTVTPLTANGADTVPQKVQVTGQQGTTAVAEVAATYSAGTVTVIKQLAGSGASQHTTGIFTMAVTCRQSESGEVVASGTVQIVGRGSATLSDSAGNPVLVPSHSHCWATETATGGATNVSIDHDSFATAVHVDPDMPDTVQQLSITVTNTFTTPADELAFTGYALGWGLPSVGLFSIGLGIWLTRRRRDESTSDGQ